MLLKYPVAARAGLLGEQHLHNLWTSLVRENSQSLHSLMDCQVPATQLGLLVNVSGIGMCPQIFYLQEDKEHNANILQRDREN